MHKLYNVKLVASHDLELSQWKSAWVASRICLCWLTDYVYRLLITYVIRLIRYVTTLGRLVDTIKRNRLKWMWGDLSRLDSMEITHYTHTLSSQRRNGHKYRDVFINVGYVEGKLVFDWVHSTVIVWDRHHLPPNNSPQNHIK